MSSSTASVMSALERAAPRIADARPHLAQDPITVLIVVPTLDVGAADVGAVGLARILKQAGHRAIVASRAGRLVADVTAAGGEFVPLDLASNNPLRMLRNAAALNRIARERSCDVDPCARPRRRLERLSRRAAARHSLPHQLVQGLSRAERLQAPL